MKLSSLHLCFPVGAFIVGLLDTPLTALVFFRLRLSFFFDTLQTVPFEVFPPTVPTFLFPFLAAASAAIAASIPFPSAFGVSKHVTRIQTLVALPGH